MPLLGPLAAEASMTCTVRARNDSVSIVLKDRKGKSRSFRIGFERPIQDSLGPVREYIKSAAAKGAGNLSPTPCYWQELRGISRALRNRSRSDGSRPSGSRTRTGAYTPPWVPVHRWWTVTWRVSWLSPRRSCQAWVPDRLSFWSSSGSLWILLTWCWCLNDVRQRYHSPLQKHGSYFTIGSPQYSFLPQSLHLNPAHTESKWSIAAATSAGSVLIREYKSLFSTCISSPAEEAFLLLHRP